MSDRGKVVLLDKDREAQENGILRELLAKHASVWFARDLSEALDLLEDDHFDALFCNWSYEGGTWRDALATVQKRFPYLPTIVVHHSGEESEWVEVLNAGGADLLAAPYNEALVQSVLDHAAKSRAAQATG